VIGIKFEISETDVLGRIGRIEINNKSINTPNLLPVIHPFENLLTANQLKEIGAEAIFTNAYILYQNNDIRESILKKGIHNFLDYNGVIATDSGAFQQYMYKKEIEIKADEIELFQETIGSDLPVILDIPVQLNDSYETARTKIIKNIERAKENILRRTDKNRNWIGPIHGGLFSDLLETSTIEMSKLDFALYAIGGLVKPFLDYRFKIAINMLLTVKKKIMHNKPLHMFGLGLPQFFSLAVACGCDLMDSAAYILFAKENRYFTTSSGTKRLDELSEFPCTCPVCSKFTPSEIKGLGDDIKTALLAKHNLYISFSELKTIKQAIKEGNLLELVETRIRNHPNLVDAYRLISKKSKFCEIYDKSYKTHGRLFSSIESSYRPIFYRFKQKLELYSQNNLNAKFLILLPELDTRGENSPTIKKWVDELHSFELYEKERLDICYVSSFFGLIPVELSEIYPLGQHEHIDLCKMTDVAFEIFDSFFSKKLRGYELIGILIPKHIINQFNEETNFSANSPIYQIKTYLQEKNRNKIITAPKINLILEYFKNWAKK
jgi:7-cyano-7-deazaguanine tRNA-ribosyltransferase